MLVLPSTRMLVLEVSFRIDWQIHACLAIDKNVGFRVVIQHRLGKSMLVLPSTKNARFGTVIQHRLANPRRALFSFLFFLFYIFCFSFFPTPLLTSDEHSAYVLLRPKFSDTGEKLLAGSSNIHLCSFKSAEFWLFFSPYIISGLGSDIAPPRSPLRLTTAARMVHLSRRPRLPDFGI